MHSLEVATAAKHPAAKDALIMRSVLDYLQDMRLAKIAVRANMSVSDLMRRHELITALSSVF